MVATSPECEGLRGQCLQTEAPGVDERSWPPSVGAGRERSQSEWLRPCFQTIKVKENLAQITTTAVLAFGVMRRCSSVNCVLTQSLV